MVFSDASSLLKRRQIRGSRACAEATAFLLRRVVESFKAGDVSTLIGRVQQVGQRLVTAQSKELAIGNIVRRVLGVIREEAEEDREGETSAYSDAGTESQSQSPVEKESGGSQTFPPTSRILTSSPLRQGEVGKYSTREVDGPLQRPPTLRTHTPNVIPDTMPGVNSMFSLLSHPRSTPASPTATPGTHSPINHPLLSRQALANLDAAKDLRAEVVEGIQEIIEELKQADDQIASYALEHIHSNEVILTHTSSDTVRKFLLKAATKRKFTVVHAMAYPNDYAVNHVMAIGESGKLNDELGPDRYQKSLTAAGITVILIPDSAVFAVMSRVNKVVLDTHVVLANGGLFTTAGTKTIAKAASMHRTPVVVLSGVYKLSPVYPFDIDTLMEDGDPSKIVAYEDGGLIDKIAVENPLFDYVPASLVDLYITNL